MNIIAPTLPAPSLWANIVDAAGPAAIIGMLAVVFVAVIFMIVEGEFPDWKIPLTAFVTIFAVFTSLFTLGMVGNTNYDKAAIPAFVTKTYDVEAARWDDDDYDLMVTLKDGNTWPCSINSKEDGSQFSMLCGSSRDSSGFEPPLRKVNQ